MRAEVFEPEAESFTIGRRIFFLTEESILDCDPMSRCLESDGFLTPSLQLCYGAQVNISMWENEVTRTTDGRRQTYPCRDDCT
jgi:hypothetical protein